MSDQDQPADLADEWGREVARLRALLDRLEWARTGFCPTCSAARGRPHDPGCEWAAVLHPERKEAPHPEG